MRARLTVPMLVIWSIAISLLSATPAAATFPGANGKIAYSDIQIYAVEPDGTNPVQLTNGFRRDKFDPAWSADGTMIAFATFHFTRSKGAIEVMNADGSGRAVVISLDDAFITDPAWSPDGSQIAFCRLRERGGRIWVVEADGSDLTRLTPPGSRDCNPDWSPDGTRIAFTSSSEEAPRSGLWVMDADGTDRVRLVRGDDAPSWSPDGTMIAFIRATRPGFRFDVFVVNADGTGRTRLTFTDRRWEFTPAWAPDGTKIAFCRNAGRGFEPCDIWTQDPGGSNPTRLTTTPGVDEFRLSWQAS